MTHIERLLTARAQRRGEACVPSLVHKKTQRRRWRILRALGVVSFATLLLIVFTPFPYFLARLTSIPPRLEPADAIVVLSGGVEPNGALSDSSFRRAVHGIALERRGLAPLLVFSGGAGDASGRPDARMALARELGVPEAHIRTDVGARTTREEAIRLSRLLGRLGARRILLVSAPQHMARAAQLFANAGLDVLPAPVEEPAHSIALTREVLQELVARFYYHLARYL
jgi:uncharacterized SAM-binding protein YcdF (DUF218 family)